MKQKKHVRQSKYGKKFLAGRRHRDYCPSCGAYTFLPHKHPEDTNIFGGKKRYQDNWGVVPNFDWILHRYGSPERVFFTDWRELRELVKIMQEESDGRDYDAFSVTDPSGEDMILSDLNNIDICLGCQEEVPEDKLIISKEGQWCENCLKNSGDMCSKCNTSSEKGHRVGNKFVCGNCGNVMIG